MLVGIIFLTIGFCLLLFLFFGSKPKQVERNNNTEASWELESAEILWDQEQEVKDIINKSWFTPERWLTDAEIDWALEKFTANNKDFANHYKILPAYQFHYARETLCGCGQKEFDFHPDNYLGTEELIKELKGSESLVFIPINNPNFHWSLLVYERNSQTFYHWDTLGGANWHYASPLVIELCKELPNDWKDCVLKHDLKQGNSYDCGIAVIALIKKISANYQGNLENINLAGLDFKKEREDLRKKYLKENN